MLLRRQKKKKNHFFQLLRGLPHKKHTFHITGTTKRGENKHFNKYIAVDKLLQKSMLCNKKYNKELKNPHK